MQHYTSLRLKKTNKQTVISVLYIAVKRKVWFVADTENISIIRTLIFNLVEKKRFVID